MKSIIIAFVFLCQIALCFSQSNNLVLKQPYVRFAGTGIYSMFPKDLITDLNLFYADVLNNGTDTQTNVSLNIKISNSVDTLFDETGLAVSSIAPDSSRIIYLDSLELLKFSPPATNANYLINYSVNQSEFDEIPDDNNASLSFTIADTIYARDIENNTNISPLQYGGTDGDFVGTSYYFPVASEVNSLSVFIDSNSTVGSAIFGKMLIEDETGNFIETINTEAFSITANDLGTWITIPLAKNGSGEFISQGQIIYVGVECFMNVIIGADSSAIHDFANESLISINNVFQSVDKVPLIRLNIVPTGLCLCCIFTNIQSVSCNGDEDGSATISTGWGIPPNTYEWDNGIDSQTSTGLSTGIHTVTITDASFDQLFCSVTINEPDYLGVYITQEGNMMQANAFGGTLPYSYYWFSGDTTQSIPNTNFGCNCIITIFDANNCSASICPSCNTEKLNNLELKLYQNALNDKLIIENAEGNNLEIFNITGVKLLETKCSEQNTIVDVSALHSGTYVLKIFNENNTIYKKICIIK